jgi:sucrose-6-phosphate hydrolase SacC (GH32 family)
MTETPASLPVMSAHARLLRERYLADPHRPGYHFVVPEGVHAPVDPNGALFYGGRYHRCYIYQHDGRHYWGHISSVDLVHWRHHPPALSPGDGDDGIYYDRAAGTLAIDTNQASLDNGPHAVEAAPFALASGEALQLRIFVDKSIVEVFANDRQAVVRRIYPTQPESLGVALFTDGAPVTVRLDAWEMMPSNPY